MPRPLIILLSFLVSPLAAIPITGIIMAVLSFDAVRTDGSQMWFAIIVHTSLFAALLSYPVLLIMMGICHSLVSEGRATKYWHALLFGGFVGTVFCFGFRDGLMFSPIGAAVGASVAYTYWFIVFRKQSIQGDIKMPIHQ